MNLFYKSTIKRFSSTNSNNLFNKLNTLIKELPHRDALMISSQNIKWSIKELDTYTTAFAKHLIELGFKPGQSFMAWSDINHSAEIICSLLGAWKAGLKVIYCESEEFDDIESCINKADVFMFSPFIQVNSSTRLDYISPKLNEMKESNKHIIQISHKSINNTIKFKQAFNYSSGLSSSIYLPNLDYNSTALEIHSLDKTNNFSFDDLFSDTNTSYDKSESYNSVVNSVPVYNPYNMVQGLIKQLVNYNYVVFPGSYSLKEITDNIKMQNAYRFICEEGLLDVSIPDNKLNNIESNSSGVKEVYIFGSSNDLKSKFESSKNSGFLSCFKNAEFYNVDQMLMNRI